MPLHAPVLARVGEVLVVRDDLIEGGTKRRVIPSLLTKGSHYVYASPAYGYAQIALAHACREAGYQATIFVAKRKDPHPRTLEAMRAGAAVVQVPTGYLSNVQSKARSFAEQHGATLLPFGLDVPEMRIGIRKVAEGLGVDPGEVWTVAGSGTLSRSLQHAWPMARFSAVRIGAACDVGRARPILAPMKFEQRARIFPPFPSCDNYDAKAWQFVAARAMEIKAARLRGEDWPGELLFWNVAA